MKPTTKETNPKPKSKKLKRTSKPTKSQVKTEAKRSKEKDPRKQATEELKQQPPNRRHTTNPAIRAWAAVW
jgi:hypothetical protein